MAEPMTEEERERLTAELDKAGLLQAEYPDEMAARSCTCEPEAVCGAHRLLARYGQLFEALQRSNREKRDAKAALRSQDIDPEVTYVYAFGNRRHIHDGGEPVNDGWRALCGGWFYTEAAALRQRAGMTRSDLLQLPLCKRCRSAGRFLLPGAAGPAGDPETTGG